MASGAAGAGEVLLRDSGAAGAGEVRLEVGDCELLALLTSVSLQTLGEDFSFAASTAPEVSSNPAMLQNRQNFLFIKIRSPLGVCLHFITGSAPGHYKYQLIACAIARHARQQRK
jgi:hypothetical protein